MQQPLTHYLKQADGAAAVLAHAALLRRLDGRLEQLLPGGLAQAARVANFKSGRLVIHADNGAVAAKIRQLGQRICSELSNSGAQCSGIDIKVQPRQSLEHSMTSALKPLSSKAAETLRTQMESLPETAPLRRALKDFLARIAIR